VVRLDCILLLNVIHGTIPRAPLNPCSSRPPSPIADALPVHHIRQAISGISCIIRIDIEDNWSSVLFSNACWVATPGIDQTTHHIIFGRRMQAKLRWKPSFALRRYSRHSFQTIWWIQAPAQRISIKRCDPNRFFQELFSPLPLQRWRGPNSSRGVTAPEITRHGVIRSELVMQVNPKGVRYSGYLCGVWLVVPFSTAAGLLRDLSAQMLCQTGLFFPLAPYVKGPQ
jgi:hypothetical protein